MQTIWSNFNNVPGWPSDKQVDCALCWWIFPVPSKVHLCTLSAIQKDNERNIGCIHVPVLDKQLSSNILSLASTIKLRIFSISLQIQKNNSSKLAIKKRLDNFNKTCFVVLNPKTAHGCVDEARCISTVGENFGERNGPILKLESGIGPVKMLTLFI